MTRRIRKAAVSLVVAVATATATAAAAIAAADGAGADPTSSSSTVTRSPTTTTTESTTTATTTAPVTVTDLDLPDGVSVAVLDLTDADTVVVGDGEQYDTASIVKVDIVAALLWQTGGDLTEQQRSLARAALTVSDNTAATTLFEQIGGADGLDEFNAAIGLTDTSAGANGNWGLTQTTVSDQIRLLEVTLGDDASVLTEDSRDWLAAVMSQVVDGQDFGVTAAADDPEDAALKVGYLQRTATGRWDVTSIGRIESGGHTLLVAVLAHDQATMSAGVAAIEQATVSAVSAIS